MFDIIKSLSGTDIYLLDQILRGRITPGMVVLDAGCGYGRNLEYFMQQGYEVMGVDSDARCIDHVRRAASELAPGLPEQNIRHEPIQSMTFPDHVADVCILNAVLHFSGDDSEFKSILEGSWRILKPGGIFFSRLCSTIGIEHLAQHLEGRRYRLPDTSTRYLVDEKMLIELTDELGGELLDPIKSTVVQNQRSMTTWVLRKKDLP
jgi:tellurite methyltransferase